MNISVNPINGVRYPLPEVLDDQSGIEDFIGRNQGKKVFVVPGLGFVGTVRSLVCSNAVNGDYAVIGVDIEPPHLN